jgi:hypothetical protein
MQGTEGERCKVQGARCKGQRGQLVKLPRQGRTGGAKTHTSLILSILSEVFERCRMGRKKEDGS